MSNTYIINVEVDEERAQDVENLLKEAMGTSCLMERKLTLTCKCAQQSGSGRDLKYVLAEMAQMHPGVSIDVRWQKGQEDFGGALFYQKSKKESALELKQLGHYLETCVPYIDVNAARDYLKGRYYVEISQAVSISDRAAKILASSEVDLYLERLEEISEGAIGFLAGHRGEALHLDSLMELTEKAAQSLGRHEGKLYLGGLRELSIPVAESLSKHKGPLHLDGLSTLSDTAAGTLAKHEGELGLNGLTALSSTVAQALSRHKGDLCLDGVMALDATAAAKLASHVGRLSLLRLPKLTDRAAEALSQHQGEIRLHGLKSVTVAGARFLIRNKGVKTRFDLKTVAKGKAGKRR